MRLNSSTDRHERLNTRVHRDRDPLMSHINGMKCVEGGGGGGGAVFI